MLAPDQTPNPGITLQFSKTAPFALRKGEEIHAPQLFGDIELATMILGADDGDVLLTCKGRYEFSVALLASWLSKRNVILPPNLHPETIKRIRKNHCIVHELSDGFLRTHHTPTNKNSEGMSGLCLDSKQQALTLYTSGSTGKPKPVIKTIGNIFAEAFTLRDAMSWPMNKALVASVPPHHLYGFTFSILLPWVLGIPIVDECPLHADEVIETIKQTDAGILVTVPIHIQSLIGHDNKLPPMMTISSAGALSENAALQWQKKYNQEIIEIYGSSETGIIAHREQLSQAGWMPFPGVDISSNQEGLLQVSSPFINVEEGKVFQTQDMVSMLEPSGFKLHGRADSIVKIAGRRISLTMVEDALKRCHGVRDAAVLAMPANGHIRDMSIWAAIALEPNANINARSIRRQLIPLLDGVKIPRRFVVVEKLPREESGKLRREKLMALFQEDRQT